MRTKIFTTRGHIHLNLKRKWFDMILSGEKKQEYRELSDYWKVRFEKLFPLEHKGEVFLPIIETIVFSNGYAKDRRQIEVEWKGTMISGGKIEWGAEDGKKYYVFQLGKIIQSNCI
jgi:hypothetical protein